MTATTPSAAAAAAGPGTVPASAASPLPKRRQPLVLWICCMSLFIVGLDLTIVNVALPAIQTDFDASVTGLQWSVDAYSLVLASLLMIAGSTADRLGRRRVFQTGLVLFTLGSLLCSLAPSLGWLVASRAMQAVGGSMLNPVAMSIIANTFTDPKERARAIGVWSGVVGLSVALGPVVGGVLVDTVGWRSVFWVNVPVGVAALLLTALFVPESKAARARRFDPVGQVLVMVLLASLVYAIIEAPRLGWASPETLGLFSVSAAALVGIVGYESRRREPLIDVRFFRSAPFSGAVVVAICTFVSFGGFIFLNTLYLQTARGFSALEAGLLTLPMAGLIVVAAPLSGRIVGTRGPRPLMALGGVALAVSTLMLVGLTNDTPLAWLFVSYAVFGGGFALVNAPITNAAVSGMPTSQAGVAAAVASTSRQVGSALGVALAGSLTLSHAGGGPLASSFAQASRPAWWTLAGASAAVLLLGTATTGAWARGTATRNAARLEHDAAAANRLADPPPIMRQIHH